MFVVFPIHKRYHENLENLRENILPFNSKKPSGKQSTPTSIKIAQCLNLFYLFLLSKPLQDVEFTKFIQLSSLIVLILFGMSFLIALSTDRNEVPDMTLYVVCNELPPNTYWLELFFCFLK